MENLELHKQLEHQNKFIIFKKKFGELVDSEKEKKETGKEYNPHLVDINIDDLNEKDAIIWESFMNGDLSFGQFSEFKNNVSLRAEKQAKHILPSEDDIKLMEKFKKGEISKGEFLDYWKKAVEQKSDFDKEGLLKHSEENFCAYLDNRIVGDKKWKQKFEKEMHSNI